MNKRSRFNPFGLIEWIKEKRKKKELPTEPIKDITAQEHYQGFDTGKVCEYCQKPIYEKQPIKTYLGKKFHLICYRQAIKDAKKEMYKL